MRRQHIVALISRTVENVNDQKWGRQLASILERLAVDLRLRFGGKSLLTAGRAVPPRVREFIEIDDEEGRPQTVELAPDEST